MAGGAGEVSNDNPLPLNVVPLIDVIFCLLLFFMCSFHFKVLEGKMEAWLPTDKGEGKPPQTPPPLGEIRVTLGYDPGQNRVTRKMGRTEYLDDAELAEKMAERFEAEKRNGNNNTPVIIESSPQVPWGEVIKVMDLAKQKGLPKLEFALAPSAFMIPDQN
jgi:biopolymer transport protein ExbD